LTPGKVISYIATWSFAGALAFSLFVVAAFRSGLVFTARKQDGTLKDHVPPAGMAAMAGFVLTLVAFILLANRLGLAGYISHTTFYQLFLLNLALYLVLFAFDTLVIDALVLGRWRPSFLKIPSEMGSTSMAEHIRRSLSIGLLSGVVLSLLTASLSCVLWAGR
jgi:hypothetical protein